MLMQAPPDPALLETQEEFYDALMADNPEDDDDESEEHGLVSKHKVGNQSYLLPLNSILYQNEFVWTEFIYKSIGLLPGESVPYDSPFIVFALKH